jgi:5-methyltetrahydrofolate--homocysteine methyltransferase
LDFDDVVASYKRQVVGGSEADILYFETLTDLSEARIGLIAAREVSDIPVVLSFTFEHNQKTVMGNPPECCAILANRMKISALATNWSGGAFAHI